jgi:DNA-binding LacI/PurR family transcriptional regulator
MRKVMLARQEIENRIARLEPAMVPILGERLLAEDLGLSRNTVRAALQQLIEAGLLKRQPNGRLQVTRRNTAGHQNFNIAFIAPTGTSGDLGEWWNSVKGIFQEERVTMHPISYEHWHAPEIQGALSTMDGAFFVAPAAKLPTDLAKRMKGSKCRVVVLDQDESSEGLPSVMLFPPSMQFKLFDHLVRLGHRRIDCINTQEEGVIIQGRLAAWQQYLEAQGMTGQLHTREKYIPTESAYQLVRDTLKQGQSLASALFCTTGPAAIGTMRALYEAGLKVGSDVSVCAVNSEGLGRYLTPTLTALESPPRAHYLRRAAHWLLSDEKWQGPLLTQPDDVPIFEGESTGPAPFPVFPTATDSLLQEKRTI